MTKRKVRRTRTPRKRVVEEEPEVEEVVEEEAVEEEVEEAPKPTRKRRSRRKAKPEPEPEPEFDEDDDEEVEIAETPPKRKRGRPRKAAPEPEPEPEPEDDEEEDESIDVTGNEALDLLLDLLDVQDKPVVLHKVGKHVILSLGLPAATRVVGKRRDRAMKVAERDAIAQTEEYVEFQEWWPGLTFEEKVKEAKKEKVTWDEHDDSLVNNLRLTMAMRAHLEIEKWRPEYNNKAARDALLYEGVRA